MSAIIDTPVTSPATTPSRERRARPVVLALCGAMILLGAALMGPAAPRWVYVAGVFVLALAVSDTLALRRARQTRELARGLLQRQSFDHPGRRLVTSELVPVANDWQLHALLRDRAGQWLLYRASIAGRQVREENTEFIHAQEAMDRQERIAAGYPARLEQEGRHEP